MKIAWKTGTKELSRMPFLPQEEGPRLVEIALLIVLIAIAIIVMVALLEPVISDFFSWIAGTLS